nr:nitroreductase family protein [Streptomonospora nanhaiensis]
MAALVARPAVRRFDPQRSVSSSTVAHLVDIARRTGSARNRQPWRFVEVRNRRMLKHLSHLGAYAQFLARAPVALAIASEDNGFADTEFDVGRVTQTIVLGGTVDAVRAAGDHDLLRVRRIVGELAGDVIAVTGRGQ